MNINSHPEPDERERAAAAAPASTPPPTDTRGPDSLRDALALARDEDGISNAKLAQQLGISTATLSQYLSRQYPGDIARIERRITDWIRTRERLRRGGIRLIESSATRTVAAALETIRRTNDIGLIHGDAGVGKTSALALYSADNPTAILITLERWSRSDTGIEGLIWREIESRAWKGNTPRGEFIVTKLRGSSRLLIVDNAHKATASGIEYLFDLHDETRIPIALVGNPEVLRHIETNDQRFSRIGLMQPVKLANPRPLVRHITREIAPQFGDRVEELSMQVVENRGSVRALVKNTSLAVVMAEAGSMAPEDAFQSAHKRLVREYALT